MRILTNLRAMRSKTLLPVLVIAVGVLGIACFAQTSSTDEGTRVQRKPTIHQSGDAPASAQSPSLGEAQEDMAKIVQSTPLLTADFEAVSEKEKSLDKAAAKLISDYRSGKSSGRVPRFGAHIVAFNALWQQSVTCDSMYAQYLDACANHFHQFHQPDMELAMRQSPCHVSVLAVMGNDYAKLHHAVSVAHAERLKLLAMENSLRTELGINPATGESVNGRAAQAESGFDKAVRAKIVPPNIHQ